MTKNRICVNTHGGMSKIGDLLCFNVVEFEFVKNEPLCFLPRLTPLIVSLN